MLQDINTMFLKKNKYEQILFCLGCNFVLSLRNNKKNNNLTQIQEKCIQIKK